MNSWTSGRFGRAAISLALVLAAGCGAAAETGGGDAAADGGKTPIAEVDAIVHRDPNCGCCAQWIVHLRDNGFTVRDETTSEIDALKERLGVPGLTQSCHTAEIGGYVIEGHVPADVIKRLLAEKPTDVAGIGVPGMPINSPGMEVPGRPAQSYEILAWDRTGKTWVYDRR